jgi:hypothetical protein
MRAGLVRPFDLVTTGVTPKAWTARQDDTMMVEKSFMVELSFAKKCGVRPATHGHDGTLTHVSRQNLCGTSRTSSETPS